MRGSRFGQIPVVAGGLRALGLTVVLFGGLARAQTQTVESAGNSWQRYDWLSDGQQHQAASPTSVTVSTSQDVKNPFDVLSSGSIWQEKVATVYTRKLDDGLSLSYETSSTLLSEASNEASPLSGGSPDDLYRGQKATLQFQPAEDFTLSGNLHDSTSEAGLPGDTTITSGAGFSAESHLPLNSVLTLGMNSDRTSADTLSTCTTTCTAYDAQLQQPLGKLPFTAMLKGHYEETVVTGSPVGRMPSLEQSLVWKPIQQTTVQMGLRQQHYEEYPGINDEFNQALFADWSQSLAGDITWHSYAEVLNSHSLVDQAPASPIASGANGTAQATTPGSNVTVASALPVSLDDQTLTFSTGPSFQIQKDISASVEYSDRWDKNPAAGNIGQEQRVSVSVKGTF